MWCILSIRILTTFNFSHLILNVFSSLRSWRYCKRPRNKVLDKRAAKPRGEWGEGLCFRVPLPILLAASPLACPKLYFAGAYNTASYAGYVFRVNCSTASEFFHLRNCSFSSKHCNLFFSSSLSISKFSSSISSSESRLFSVEVIKKKILQDICSGS